MQCFICGFSSCELKILAEITPVVMCRESIRDIINTDLLDPSSPVFISESDNLCSHCIKLCTELNNTNENIGERVRNLLQRTYKRTYELNGSDCEYNIETDYEALQIFTYKCQRCSYTTNIFENICPHYFVHKIEDLDAEKRLIQNKTTESDILNEVEIQEETNCWEHEKFVPEPVPVNLTYAASDEEIEDVPLDSGENENIEFTKCPLCDFEAPNDESMRTHITKNHKVNRRIARTSKHLEKKTNKSGANSYCETCGFQLTDELCTHALVAKFDLQPIKCEKCHAVVYMKHLVKYHAKTKHRECSYCGEEFSSMSELYSHEREHKERHEKLYFPCTWCSHEMQSVSRLRDHMRIHTGFYKYTCDICESGFIRRVQFDEHMAKHTNTPRFICNLCGKDFINNVTFRLHQMLHKDEFPSKCTLCSKAFRNPSRLATHRRREHLNQPDEHKCRYCGKMFPGRTSKRQHEMDHTRSYPHFCTECNQGFASREKFGRHMSNIHNDDSIKNSKTVCKYKVVVPRDDIEDSQMIAVEDKFVEEKI